MLDTASINYLTKEIKPDEFYNLAAQSHVHYSFQAPDYTTQVNAISVIKILEGIAKLSPKTKFTKLAQVRFMVILNHSNL